MKRAKRPAGLRIATRGTVRTVRPLRDAEKALAATARLSLASLDTDMLRRLWTTRRGGSVLEYNTGELEVRNEHAESLVRGTPAAVTTWLRRTMMIRQWRTPRRRRTDERLC
jgi:hypothetical protein